MTIRTFSISEARNRFTAIVRSLKHRPRIEVTRRGKPVAVMLSIEEYQRISGEQGRFWEAYQEFREETTLEELDIDPEIFEVRDSSPGRDISL